MYYKIFKLTLKAPKIKTVEFVNSVVPDEVAYNELPHLDLHCFPLVFDNSVRDILDETFLLKFCRHKL